MSKLVFIGEMGDVRAGKHLMATLTDLKINPDRVDFRDVTKIGVPDDAEWVVLSGNIALQHFIPYLRTGQCHGRPMLLNKGDLQGPVAYPVFNHRACHRSKPLFDILRLELERLRQLAIRKEWHSLTPLSCVKCRRPADHTDRHYARFCDLHWRS